MNQKYALPKDRKFIFSVIFASANSSSCVSRRTSGTRFFSAICLSMAARASRSFRQSSVLRVLADVDLRNEVLSVTTHNYTVPYIENYSTCRLLKYH